MTHDSTTPATETTPAFTVVILSASNDEFTLRLSVRIPETAAPLVLNDEGEEERDHGNADWPEDAEIVAEVKRLTGRDVVLGDWSEGDDLLETIYSATDSKATTLDVALEFAREEGIAWAEEIEGEFHSDDDRDNWLASADRDPRGWWNKCAFDTVRDRVSAEIWDEYSSELSEACADACAEAIREAAGDAEDEDDGQPSDLQEHEDFAHDNDFEPCEI